MSNFLGLISSSGQFTVIALILNSSSNQVFSISICALIFAISNFQCVSINSCISPPSWLNISSSKILLSTMHPVMFLIIAIYLMCLFTSKCSSCPHRNASVFVFLFNFRSFSAVGSFKNSSANTFFSFLKSFFFFVVYFFFFASNCFCIPQLFDPKTIASIFVTFLSHVWSILLIFICVSDTSMTRST